MLAYITRDRGSGPELLVFAHRDQPEAGLQVPAGTVEPGEDPDAAVIREVWEETGIVLPATASKLGITRYEADAGAHRELHERHVYHLLAPAGLPDRWERLAEGRYVFRFRWVPLAEVPDLAGGQDACLAALRRALCGRRGAGGPAA